MSTATRQPATFSGADSFGFGENLARRRGQKTGHVKRKGPSWLLQWREYQRDETGADKPIQKALVIAPAEGPDRVSKREAERIAREQYLPKIDHRNTRPGSMMLVSDFVQQKFEPMVMWKKKPSGQKHYRYILNNHLLPEIGSRRLCDISVEDVESVIRSKYKAGYSSQTILHIKNAVSAVFRLAKRLKMYQDENPAFEIEMPEVRAKKRPTFNASQLCRVLESLPLKAALAARLSIETSMNVAEMCGLRVKWLNMTNSIAVVEGEVLAPCSLAVRENYYEGEYGSLKKGSRCRNLPITPELAAALHMLIQSSVSNDPEAPVFQSRTGTPIDAHNVTNRVFRPLSKKLGFQVNWHAFRRAHSTLAGMIGAPLEDRAATMGHADKNMSLHYSVADIERRRQVPMQIMSLVIGKDEIVQ